MIGPIMELKRGIVIDKCQPMGIPPSESARIKPIDMEIIKNIGADHVKVLFTPSSFIENDHLDYSKLLYIEEVVNMAIDEHLHCLICIHPEAPFKKDYLASAERFEVLLNIYDELSTWIGSKWNENEIAFQIMTEPFANYTDWNEMHPKLWSIVRENMPHHTLVLSGDRVGHLFGLLSMIPVDDDNVYYGYTSYDPFAFTLQSWNEFFCGTSKDLNCIGHIPYPASPEIVESRMDDILSTVPDEFKESAKNYVKKYGDGEYQQGNHGFFNREWHDRRLSWVDEWRKTHGKNLPVLCNEFGVMDHIMGRKYGGPGCLPQERLLFLKDIREMMEKHNIGWSYWSYNETFTIFDPEKRHPFGHDDESLLDTKVLKALGLV